MCCPGSVMLKCVCVMGVLRLCVAWLCVVNDMVVIGACCWFWYGSCSCYVLDGDADCVCCRGSMFVIDIVCWLA